MNLTLDDLRKFGLLSDDPEAFPAGSPAYANRALGILGGQISPAWNAEIPGSKYANMVANIKWPGMFPEGNTRVGDIAEVAGGDLTDFAYLAKAVGDQDWKQAAMIGGAAAIPALSFAAMNKFTKPRTAETPQYLGDSPMGQGQAGMVAFHGSPHKFDQFSLENIGTGEGAQAYGHGLYFAESPGVAETYKTTGPHGQALTRKVVSKNGTEIDVPEWLGNQIESQSIDQSIYTWADNLGREKKLLNDGNQPWLHEANVKRLQSELDTLKKIKAEGLDRVEQAGHFYEVDIPDEHVKNFLDWDTPVDEHSQLSRTLMEMAGDPDYPELDADEMADALGLSDAYRGQPEDGSTIYSFLSSSLGGDAAASKALNEYGIKGIRYLDGDSRSAGRGTSNLVVFDDSIVKTLKRDDQPVGLLMDNSKSPWQMSKAEYNTPKELKPEEYMWIDTGGNKVEVAQNPSANELSNMKKEAIKKYGEPAYGDPALRFTEDAAGNKYYWNAGDAIHANIEPALKEKLGVEVNQNASNKMSHRQVVRKALYDGENVPQEVINEYPGIVEEVMSFPKNKMLNNDSRMNRASELGYTKDSYSGSTHDITEFDGSIANSGNDWGRAVYSSTSIDDVNNNYAGVGPDLTARLEMREEAIADTLMHDEYMLEDAADELGIDVYDAPDMIDIISEQLARKELIGEAGEGGAVYPLKINDSDYAVIGGPDSTKLKGEDYFAQARDELDPADYADEVDYDDAVIEYADELRDNDVHGLYQTVYDALSQTDIEDDAAIGEIVDTVLDDIVDGELDLADLDAAIRENAPETFSDIGDLQSPGEISKQVLENLGYKGVIDNTVPEKFGPGRRGPMGIPMGQMKGVDYNTQHIITFPGRENTIRSRYAKFDPQKTHLKDITAGVSPFLAPGVAAMLGLHSINGLLYNEEYR